MNEPVKFGESTDGYKIGATVRGSATQMMRLALRSLLCQGFMEVSFNKGPWGTNNRNVDVHMPVRLESVIMEMQWDVSYD